MSNVATREWCDAVCDACSLIQQKESAEQHSYLLERLDRSFSSSEESSIYDAFSGKKRKALPGSGIRSLLTAVEREASEAERIVWLRLLSIVVRNSSKEGERKTEKSLIRADVVSSLSRTLRQRLQLGFDTKGNRHLDNKVDELLLQNLVALSQKDGRFCLKLRVGGLLSTMCRTFCAVDVHSLHQLFLLLFIRLMKSPRNAQMSGRQEGLVDRLCLSISSSSSKDSDLALLDLLLQLFALVTKNKKTRIDAIRRGIVRTIVNILSRNLSGSRGCLSRLLPSSLRDDSAHSKVALSAVAALRPLANNKKAREEMLSYDLLSFCEKELEITASQNSLHSAVCDALCALCMRILPPQQYPFENTKFSFEWPLPASRPRLNSNLFEGSFEEFASSDEEGDDEGLNDANAVLTRLSRQSAENLSNYSQNFREYFEGAGAQVEKEAADQQSIYDDECQATKIAIPTVCSLPIDVFRLHEEGVKLGPTHNEMRKVVVEEIERVRTRSQSSPTIVFDIDATACGQTFDNVAGLRFESRFECGNLRRATLVNPTHYELFLSPDVNQLSDHFQWFFFQVSNMEKDTRYTFEIANFIKSTSMFNHGMQPVMFSMVDGRGWRRVGSEVCYLKNLYSTRAEVDEKSGEEGKKRSFYSLRFDVVFDVADDVCLFAYHFPYSHSYLNTSLRVLLSPRPGDVYMRCDNLTTSVGGNVVKLITLTAAGSAADVAMRNVVVLSARVHPGETNSSWIMQGILDRLATNTDDETNMLRDKYVFKIVPMLNPDGVASGSHRCSLAGVDLNRVWDRPSEALHPEIYHTKGIIQYMCDVLGRRPTAFVDIHGHSRKMDCFMFGNSAAESWLSEDGLRINDQHIALPTLLEKTCDGFNMAECRFSIVRSKEASARVCVWRQFDVSASYTLECTYSGYRTGRRKGQQISVDDLQKTGRQLLTALLHLPSFIENCS